LCFDEEASNDANFANAQGGDSTRMNNIIKSKIGDALTWVCLHASVEMLTGNDGSSAANFVADINCSGSDITDINIGGRVTIESDFLRLIRVRGAGWHRGVMTPLSEDSEEYLQLYDTNGAAATVDRPQAAIILAKDKKLEVYPKPNSFVYTYVKDPLASGTDYSSVSSVTVPNKAHASFIYYLAYLTLSAYGDPRAPRMLEIAIMNLSRTDIIDKK